MGVGKGEGRLREREGWREGGRGRRVRDRELGSRGRGITRIALQGE